MIANAKKAEQNLSGPAFFQDLSAFAHKHEAVLDIDDEAVEDYLDQAATKGEQLFNIDRLPNSVRQFIELQNRLSGRDVGRGGQDQFLSEENDASMGMETDKQRTKRENRAFWFRRLIDSMIIMTSLYEDTYKMTVNAEKAVEIALDEIKDDEKRINRSDAGIKVLLEKEKKGKTGLSAQEKKALKDSLVINKNYKKRLKQEKEDLTEYKEKVIKPAKKKINEENPSEAELKDITKNIDERMPGRGWRILKKLIDGMRNQFNSFPRLRSRIHEPVASAPTPVPTLAPSPTISYDSQDIEDKHDAAKTDTPDADLD